jgi:hypothetical protein
VGSMHRRGDPPGIRVTGMDAPRGCVCVALFAVATAVAETSPPGPAPHRADCVQDNHQPLAGDPAHVARHAHWGCTGLEVHGSTALLLLLPLCVEPLHDVPGPPGRISGTA